MFYDTITYRDLKDIGVHDFIAIIFVNFENDLQCLIRNLQKFLDLIFQSDKMVKNLLR